TPDVHADDAVRGLGLREAVVDVRAQRVQGHAALAVPLGARDLGAVQAAGHADLHAQGAEAHGVGHRPLHGAAEHDAALDLLRHALRDEVRVQLRLADLLHADRGLHAQHLRDLLAQPLDLVALLADHDAGPGGVDDHARVAGRALDLDPAHGGARQPLAQEFPHPQVLVQVPRVVLAVRVPGGRPVLDDAQPDARRMYFLSHAVLRSSR